MAVVQLATSTDVVAVLGRALTSSEVLRVEPILDKASELFRRRARQTFSNGTSTVRLKVNGGRVYLPQRPVTAVASVVDDAGVVVTYTLADQWLTLNTVLGDKFYGSDAFVTVAYTHGGVPELVRLCIADVARQVLTIDANAQVGVSQHAETRGPFTESSSYATWAVGGSTRLSPEDNALADSYRFRAPSVVVMTS